MLFIVESMSGMSDRKCFHGVGRTEKEAIQDAGGMKSQWWVSEYTREDALFTFPSFEMEIDCA